MQRQIVLLDAANVAIRNIDVKRAMKFIANGFGESVLDSREVLHSATHDYPIPSIIRLNSARPSCYQYLYRPLRWSKRGVMRRDDYVCAYCGEHAQTIDHIFPKSKGGKNEWMNTIACCASCNSRKGNSLLEDIGMSLQFSPFVPARVDLIQFNDYQSDYLMSLGMSSVTDKRRKRRALVA